ncbi:MULTISPECIES: fumarylacetoacetate hydrolase family protein [Pantoea]|jgi:2-keto-4-pentenoate hydratase/2-oxohepta-3-ene-1,7-dioic acid hydratase in catechol pathway|uniref:Fumarylacetoacetate hydrolase family protein n=1 Tax=Pantoea piersonii TaxID=2364647 RepID=A0AAJ5U9K7_9GAMM|nr:MULTISPECIES: fumarylacetoacetate hydrolase family protein [Pantoea]HCW99277.1 5-oxopent-3-ene-1,2,5-tricarboxylate decarboxylase [Pantoea sp.]MBZ6386732.1 fumarylacetoacetate hydrolase family protein [Pantoea piersonii]MBZ6399590.1 fumarylacetoacetate hydrolase family protein [Pantoea piersonii]MBZ6408643.1 fumarylacetoacetate hydrolase family protein [Pantoea piersonii]MBZ6425609.1 fumarylacetoacetate hydrolase family protein [Pantoea piersonii]
MQLCSFYLPDQARKSFGIVRENGVVDVGLRLGAQCPDLKTFLERSSMADLAAFREMPADYAFSALQFLPVIENPGKVFCVGMNYADKRKEFSETLDAPTLFIRFADSLTGHDRPLLKPATTSEFDYEGELAVIIGKPAHQVKAAQALEYVAGYSCFMDATVRDMQFTWFTAGKNWPQTGGFGPWMTTAEAVGDPQALAIKTFLNGREVQNDTTGSMVHKVANIIEYISAFSPLSPGDVIFTGSPGGVGKKRTPPLFMFSGDVVEVEIEKIGRLRNVIA